MPEIQLASVWHSISDQQILKCLLISKIINLLRRICMFCNGFCCRSTAFFSDITLWAIKKINAGIYYSSNNNLKNSQFEHCVTFAVTLQSAAQFFWMQRQYLKAYHLTSRCLYCSARISFQSSSFTSRWKFGDLNC